MRADRRGLLDALAHAPTGGRGTWRPWRPPRARVVTAGLAEEELSPARALRALDRALAALGGEEQGSATLARLFAPDDVVGIKLNCLGGPHLSPRPMLVESLVELLVRAGVPARRVILFERSRRELTAAGFPPGEMASGAGVRAIGNDYERRPTETGRIGSCFARLVTTTCTALISFGVVKDHDLAGVSAGMKNWYGVIHNPNKYHDTNCDPYVADVVRTPAIADRLRLTVLDGIRGQCDRGPAFHPEGSFALGRVAVSADPVAVDVWAWEVIDAERRRRGLPSLAEAGRPPRFLATAAGHGLGVAEADEIERVST